MTAAVQKDTETQIYKRWLASDKLTEEEKKELLGIEGDAEEIKKRFGTSLSFGTAGLRGTMAVGTNNMNIYTVCQATMGFASYIRRTEGEAGAQKGVVIAYDSRLCSCEYARASAAVMAKNGIRVYLFDGLRPTPELSFAVRRLGAIAGINITASHNPKQYNGYKAYWSDGAQLSPEQADEVSKDIRAVELPDGIDYCEKDFDSAVSSGAIQMIGDEIDEAFLRCVTAQSVCPDAVKETADRFSVVYTPLYGAGCRLIPEAMRRIGLKNLYTVDEQMTPDGTFPTTPFPNPELPQVFELAIKKAEEKGADIIIASDPDADRTGVMIKDREGRYITLTGNQIGAMLLDYIITAKKESGTFPAEPFAVKTIVSTDIVEKMCAVHGVKLYNVLTGFKFIGKVVTDREAETGKPADGDYLLGFEESNGYSRGTYLRDKDAVCASALLCEMAAFHLQHGKSVYDALCEMYEKYGLYKESTSNIYVEGSDGAERMAALMSRLRSTPPESLGGDRLRYVRDYLTGVITDLATGSTSETGLPESNVLFYETEDGNKIIIRPSGTEPKIKIYYLLHDDSSDEAALQRKLEAYQKSMDALAAI